MKSIFNLIITFFFLSCSNNALDQASQNLYNDFANLNSTHSFTPMPFVDRLSELYFRLSDQEDLTGNKANSLLFLTKSEEISSKRTIYVTNPMEFGILPIDMKTFNDAKSRLESVSNHKNADQDSEKSQILAESYIAYDMWLSSLSISELKSAKYWKDKFLKSISLLEDISSDVSNEKIMQNYSSCYMCKRIVSGNHCNAFYFVENTSNLNEYAAPTIKRFLEKLNKDYFENPKISIYFYSNSKNKKLTPIRLKSILDLLVANGLSKGMSKDIIANNSMPEDRQLITNNPFFENGVELCIKEGER